MQNKKSLLCFCRPNLSVNGKRARDGTRTRDSLLGRQVVTESPLASYKLALQAARTKIFWLHAPLRKVVSSIRHKCSRISCLCLRQKLSRAFWRQVVGTFILYPIFCMKTRCREMFNSVIPEHLAREYVVLPFLALFSLHVLSLPYFRLLLCSNSLED
jgi:hypothetical protein